MRLVLVILAVACAEHIITEQPFHYCTDGHGKYAYTPEDFVLPTGWRIATERDQITTPLIALPSHTVVSQPGATYPDGTEVVANQLCQGSALLLGWGGVDAIMTLRTYGDVNLTGLRFVWHRYGTSDIGIGIAVDVIVSGHPNVTPGGTPGVTSACAPITGDVPADEATLVFTGFTHEFRFNTTSSGFTACGLQWNPVTGAFTPDSTSSTAQCRVGVGIRYSSTDSALFMLERDVPTIIHPAGSGGVGRFPNLGAGDTFTGVVVWYG